MCCPVCRWLPAVFRHVHARPDKTHQYGVQPQQRQPSEVRLTCIILRIRLLVCCDVCARHPQMLDGFGHERSTADAIKIFSWRTPSCALVINPVFHCIHAALLQDLGNFLSGWMYYVTGRGGWWHITVRGGLADLLSFENAYATDGSRIILQPPCTCAQVLTARCEIEA